MIILLLLLFLQMHGYDSSGMQPMHNNMPPHQHNVPLDSIGHHPDSTDSYVTYLESDESIPNSP